MVLKMHAFQGIVKSWNPQKGWGHLECEATQTLYGKDVFLLRSALPDQSINPAKGTKVNFNVRDGPRGPEASDVVLRGAANGKASNGSNGRIPAWQGKPQAQHVQEEEVRFFGTVKSFGPSGWGHIKCPQAQALIGKDVFFMKSQVAGGSVPVGAEVSFTIQHGQKGPEAANVEMVVPTVKHASTPMKAPAAKVGAFYYGTMKSFNEEKGWGHIDCAQTRELFSRDMFVMRSAFGEGTVITAGQLVSFVVKQGLKGPEAAEAKVIDADEDFYGSIKSFNPEKGWGHIKCDDARALYGKDIFLHKNQLDGQVPEVGTELNFKVELATDGRPEARNVELQAAVAYGALSRKPQGRGKSAPYSLTR